MPASTIRTATENDVPNILALARAWVDEEVTWGQEPLPEDLLRSRLSPLSLVAEGSDGLLGYAFGHISVTPIAVIERGPYLEIEEIFVAAVARGHGIGSALLEDLLKRATQFGVEQASVFTATRDQSRAVAFYTRQGFTPWGTQLFRRLP